MRRRRPGPQIIEAEFLVVGQEPPKPWWRRLYLKPGWWIIALLSGLQILGALVKPH